MPKDPSYPQGVARPAFITRWLDYQLRRDPLLKLDLEDLFGRRVDLLTPKCLQPAMQTEIDKEAILVP